MVGVNIFIIRKLYRHHTHGVRCLHTGANAEEVQVHTAHITLLRIGERVLSVCAVPFLRRRAPCEHNRT